MVDDARQSRGGARDRSARAAAVVAVALLVTACGADDTPAHEATSSGSDAGTACAPGEWAGSSGACLAAGTQEDGCDAGEHLVEGACRPAGIPPDACGTGFTSTDDGACAPILSATPCAPGKIAVPGETACHAVAECGAAPWGDAPSDPTTRYVDGGYSGAASDGSQAKPYKTIQAAIDAAPSGSVVAIAAGTYAETLLIVDRPVVLWGRCPEMVELVGGDPAAIEIGVGASGTRVRGLAIRGAQIGVAVTGAEEVVAERVWIHDTGDVGFLVENVFASSEATLDHALVEAASKLGVYVAGATATLDASVVRDVAEAGGAGDGVWAEASGGARAAVVVSGSVVERAHEAGVYGKNADVTVEDSVIREIAPVTATGIYGVGVAGEAAATIHVRRSVLSANHDAALFALGSEVSVEGSVLRDTEAASDGQFGRGINVEAGTDGEPSTLTVADSVIVGNSSAGIFVGGSTATIDATIIRETRARPADGLFGMGIDCESKGAMTTVRASVIERNHDVGIFFLGAEGRVEGTLIKDTQPRPGDLLFGRGIEADAEPEPALSSKVTVEACRVEHNSDFGIYIGGSEVTITSTLVDDTLPRASNQYFGRGVGVEALFGVASSVSLTHSLVSRSRDFGVLVLDSGAVLDAVVVRDTSAASDGTFGDGIGLLREAVFGGASLEVTASRVERSKRAGISGFGGSTSIGSTALECNPVQLDGETYEGHAPEFEDLGANVCGCKGVVATCTLLSASLEPPKAAGNH